jgi:hypothetical protein
MEGVIKCYKDKFPKANIFTIRFPIQVFWGSISILEVSYINALLHRLVIVALQGH